MTASALPRLCALLLLAAATLAGAQPAALRLAFNELEPWKTVENGEHGGAYTEIVRELARRLGQPLQIVDCPLKRCMKLLEAGEADLAIGLRQTPDRLQYLHYLATPYRRVSADRVFLVRPGDARRITRYEDLRELRIAVTSGSEYFARFNEDATLTKDAAPNSESSLRKLLLGRVDTALMPEDQAMALLAHLGLMRQVEVAPFRVPDATSRSLAISLGSPLMARLPEVELAMRRMREDGTLAAIYDRHYYQRYQVTRQRLPID